MFAWTLTSAGSTAGRESEEAGSRQGGQRGQLQAVPGLLLRGRRVEFVRCVGSTSGARGGLSTKIHQLVDGRGRPLVIMLTPGQAGDSPMLQPLLAQLAVRRLGPGRPRTRPAAVIGDKAYSSRGTRSMLIARGITAVIPQPSDQIAHRRRRGALPAAARQASTRSPTRAATSSSAPPTTTSSRAASPPATTNSPPSTGEQSSCAPSRSG